MVNWSVSKSCKQIQTGIVQFANLCQMRILLRNLSEADLFWIELRVSAFLDKVISAPQGTENKAQPKKNQQHSPNSLKDFTAELAFPPDSLCGPMQRCHRLKHIILSTFRSACFLGMGTRIQLGRNNTRTWTQHLENEVWNSSTERKIIIWNLSFPKFFAGLFVPQR